jgi:membrane dipeptidase
MFEENQDLIFQVFSVTDILKAKLEGKTGVILSWQNTAGIEDRIEYLQDFSALGVKIMQLAYNTQNYSGCGYVEDRDSGLTGFGREVVDEMARLGIACDLSHVGTRTIEDVIGYAKQPPCFSHVLPAGLKALRRNIPDDLIRAVGACGGMIGLSDFGPLMRNGNESTVADYLAAIEYAIDLAGENHVGIGSDSTQGHPRPSSFLAWCNKDKGNGRLLTKLGEGEVTRPLGCLANRPALGDAMVSAGWDESRIRKVLGSNWVGYWERVWRQ